MKDKIKAIINKHVFEVGDNLRGTTQAAEEIMQLMCYREVRAFCNPYQTYLYVEWEDLKEFLSEDYPDELIDKAIEQFKNEQK